MRSFVLAVVAVAGLGLCSCGPELAAPKPKSLADMPRMSRRIDPEELFPRDLDLSLRFDLGKVKNNLGPLMTDKLSARLGDDPLLAKALPRARVVTLGLRVTDLELGDRVIALEGDMENLAPNATLFREEKTANDRVSFYVRRDDAKRDDVGAIIKLENRALVFVSPVEIDAVKRVLGGGPDEHRLDPSAEGVISVDYRPRRLPRSTEKKFPSVGRIIAELASVRGTVEVEDKGVVLDLTFVARTDAGAGHVKRFIEVLRDNSQDQGLSAVLRDIDIDAASSTLHVRWTLPPEVVLHALSDETKTPAPPARSTPSSPAPAPAPSTSTSTSPSPPPPPSLGDFKLPPLKL